MAVYKFDDSDPGVIDGSSGIQVDRDALHQDGYAESIGNGVATSFVITHGLDTQDVGVYVTQVDSPYEVVDTTVDTYTPTSVAIRFAIPPTTNQYRVVVRPTRAQEVFNVMDFGAVGNGIADDAPAVQDALDACAGTGGIVLFPSGHTFLISTPKTAYVLLQVGSDTNIVATGATIKRGITRILLCNWSDPFSDTPLYSGPGNISIDGGLWDNNAAGTIANNTMSFSHMTNLTVKNATFKDMMRVHALDIGGCRKVRIDNCIFHGMFFDTTLDPNRYREAVQIDHCGTGNGHNEPADNTVCQDVVVSRCTARTTATTAPAGYIGGPPGGLAGQHSLASQPPTQHTNIKFLYNIIEDFRFAGLRVMGMNGVLIQGNIIRRSGTHTPGSLTYEGGVTAALYGSEPTSQNVRIVGNRFSGAGITPFIGGNDTTCIIQNNDNVAE